MLAVKEELLDYASFVSFVRNMVSERMGEGYSIKLFKVMKNNSLELDSLVVLKEGRNFAPNIYLNAYYDSYIAGTDVIEIVDRICMIYDHCSIPIVQEDFEYTLEHMRPYIFFVWLVWREIKSYFQKSRILNFLILLLPSIVLYAVRRRV